MDEVINRLLKSVKDVSELPECRTVSKQMYANLVRRIKLLSPLIEELHDDSDYGDKQLLLLGDEILLAFSNLSVALDSAVLLLKSVNQGSKIRQAMDMENFALTFHQMTEQIEAALNDIPYNNLKLPEEVRAQIELVHTQFTRAKEKMDSPDIQLEKDLVIVQKEKNPDVEVFKRLSEKLQLRTINDLTMEAVAFHELVILSDGNLGDDFQIMQTLLQKLNSYVMTRKPEADIFAGETSLIKHRSPVIPDDFQCPISLALMKDPVIVSSGQTYERQCIKTWLEAGNKTCPKTQQTLLHTTLTPNYVLKSIIALWCESNGIDHPKKQGGTSKTKRLGHVIADSDRMAINSLLQKLNSGNPEDQRAAAGELRLLAKRDADNRVFIAEEGAIPLLVDLLSSSDPRTQEHAVTALLNLSIDESNKGKIVSAGAIPNIVDVLKNGSMEARENAAATLFSLSAVDHNKVAIGVAGAMPALIDLLCQGTPRGKKDAATAIFNLSFFQGNKVLAIKAGIVAPLMVLLKDAGGGMVDEALAILAILASHQEGKLVIGEADPIPILIDVIRTCSPRNRENAASLLFSICTSDFNHVRKVRELSAEEILRELYENGTDRARRKAGYILGLLEQVEKSN